MHVLYVQSNDHSEQTVLFVIIIAKMSILRSFRQACAKEIVPSTTGSWGEVGGGRKIMNKPASSPCSCFRMTGLDSSKVDLLSDEIPRWPQLVYSVRFQIRLKSTNHDFSPGSLPFTRILKRGWEDRESGVSAHTHTAQDSGVHREGGSWWLAVVLANENESTYNALKSPMFLTL